VFGREGAGAERLGEDVGRRHRVLDGDIDADATDRRHGVGGVADAQQSRPVPPLQPIDFGGQKLDIIPARKSVRPVAEPQQQRLERASEIANAIFHEFSRRAFGNHIGGLPIVAAIDHGEEAAALDVAPRSGRWDSAEGASTRRRSANPCP
jgi:hypothetical protein